VHLALTRGEIRPDVPTLVRVHEPFSSLDLFDFDNGRHAYSVAEAMRIIATEGTGVIVLMRRHETAADVLTRLAPKDDRERRAQKWDPRTHGIGAQILRGLNVRKMRVLARPMRIPSMAGFDLEAVEYLPPDSIQKLKVV
jgi:3,4-dihydroxy 2-butanone 4-phosphate synthase / GTP cyclohydrolase II